MFFEKTILPNNISVVSETLPGCRSVSLGLWFNVGTRDEKANQAGLAHFMEHMMFKGTPTLTPLDISMHFDSLGAELNAFTSKETTCYYARFVDDKLEDAISYLSDMVLHSVFSSDAIETEREVVIEEISRSEDTPDDHVFEVFSTSLLNGHELGCPVLGNRSQVRSFTHESCVSFHKEHYTGGNLCVAASGNLSHETLVNLVKRYFAEMPYSEKRLRNMVIPNYQAGHFFKQRDIEQAHIVYGFPGLEQNHPYRFALSLLSCALGGSMASRLFQEVREKRGLAYSIFSSQTSYQGAGQWFTYAGTRPANISQVISLIEAELEKVSQSGLEADELTRYKDLICGQLLLGLESTSSHMIRLGKQETLGLETLSIDEAIKAYHDVASEEVIEVARMLFNQAPSIAIISPFTEEEMEKTLK